MTPQGYERGNETRIKDCLITMSFTFENMYSNNVIAGNLKRKPVSILSLLKDMLLCSVAIINIVI